MADTKPRDDQDIGHSSTTAPGGEKDMPQGDPGRTPGKAEGDDETADKDLRQKQDKAR